MEGEPSWVRLLFAGPLPSGPVSVAGSFCGADGAAVRGTVLADGEAPAPRPWEGRLREEMPPRFQGFNWSAEIAAAGEGVAGVGALALKAFDQMFVPTAEGEFLDDLCADRGVVRPGGVGLPDELLRRLPPLLARGQASAVSLSALLEVWFGLLATRASMRAAPEPYDLGAGESLLLGVGRWGLLDLAFPPSEFVSPGKATAAEVAAVVSRRASLCRSPVWATAQFDPVSKASRLTVFAGSLGLAGKLWVAGGTAAPALGLPPPVVTLTPPPLALPTWEWVPDRARRVCLLRTTGPSRMIPNSVRAGDFVVISGAEFAPANRGWFAVLSSRTDIVAGAFRVTITIDHPASIAAGPTTQRAVKSLTFFRPEEASLSSSRRSAYTAPRVAARGPTIVVPVFSTAVRRGPGTAAYLVGPPDALPASAEAAGGAWRLTPARAGLFLLQGEIVLGGAPILAAASGRTSSSPCALVSGIGPAPALAYSACCQVADEVLLAGGEDRLGAATDAALLVRVSMPHKDTLGYLSAIVMSTGAPPMPEARTRAAAVAVPGGALVAGGVDGAGAVARSTFLLPSPSPGAWVAAGSLSVPRVDIALVAVPGGALAVGGADSAGQPSSACEVWRGGWAAANPLPEALTASCAAPLPGGRAVLVGGVGLVDLSSRSYLWDGASWTRGGGSSWMRAGGWIVPVGPRLLLLGGFGRPACCPADPIVPLLATEWIDPATGRLSPGPPLPAPPTAALGGETAKVVVGVALWELSSGKWKKWPTPIPGIAPRAVGAGRVLSSGDQVYAVVPGPLETSQPAPRFPVRVSASGLAQADFSGFGRLSSATLTPINARGSAGAHSFYGARPGEVPAPYQRESRVTLTPPLGATSLLLASSAPFASAGGWAVGDPGGRRVLFRYVATLPGELLLASGQDLRGLAAGARVSPCPPPPATPPPTSLAAWVPSAALGRLAAQDSVAAACAAGFEPDFVVVYPSDRGLGGEGYPTSGDGRLSDAVLVWGTDEPATSGRAAR